MKAEIDKLIVENYIYIKKKVYYFCKGYNFIKYREDALGYVIETIYHNYPIAKAKNSNIIFAAFISNHCRWRTLCFIRRIFGRGRSMRFFQEYQDPINYTQEETSTWGRNPEDTLIEKEEHYIDNDIQFWSQDPEVIIKEKKYKNVNTVYTMKSHFIRKKRMSYLYKKITNNECQLEIQWIKI